ncbi:MAG: tetratricopeptide repeat protein [Candidatus Aminicenantaceae bacterium]
MKKPRILVGIFGLLIIPVLISSNLFPQDWKGKGRVRGAVLTEEGEPIVGCKVILTSPRFTSANIEILTDKKGEWKASMIRGGVWNIDFVAEGYEIKKISTTISEALRGKPIEARLKRAKESVVIEKVSGLLQKGNELFNQGKFQEALEEYKKIKAENPDFYQIHQNIGNCYYELGDTEKAIDHYQIVLESDPQSVEALVSLGNIYLEGGELEKGLSYIKQIKEEDITTPITFYNIGTLFFTKRKTDLAIEYYAKAIAKDPNLSDVYYQIALCYVQKNDKEKAIENFEKYLELDPESPKAPDVKNMIEFLKKE